MHFIESLRHRAGSMPAIFAWLGLVFATSLLPIAPAHAASIEPALLPTIQAATFEVVAAKPVSDPLTYDKPLPLELLPYQERNDKYFSIGTAFALGNNRYVTAAHVLQVGIGSLWGEPSLRDANGRVYAIDQIEKYSMEQDFVVFSLTAPPAAGAALEVNTSPSMNGVVYAVGNALGTGVVIRDGLYTSDTPEDQDGRWKWMRFSAAASPGNSGGPLLDAKGKVIGIVLMKSANENLNYALPISRVLEAPDHLASIDARTPYQFDVFDTVLSNTFKAQFKLPLSFADFSAAFQQRFNAYADGQLKALLAKEPDRTFPQGEGSNALLHSAPSMHDFPALITRDNDGTWSLARKSGDKTTLPDNGYVMPGVAGGRNLLFQLRKPDSMSAHDLYTQPKQMMDMLARIGLFQRQIGPEKIRITSLGEPTSDTIYTDRWQRHWQVRSWPVPHENVVVLTFALPVPNGYMVLMRFAPPIQQHDYLINLQALTDFFYVTYDGTLAQWQDFLTQKDLLPAVFKDIQIDIDYGRRFAYTSKRLRYAYTPALQKIEKDSLLTLGFSYFPDHDKVVWDVADVWQAASAHEQYWSNFARSIAPSSDLNDDFKSRWNKILQRKRPYDAVPRSENDVMKITTVLAGPDGDKSDVLYSVYHYAEGKHAEAEMKSRMALLLENAEVTER